MNSVIRVWFCKYIRVFIICINIYLFNLLGTYGFVLPANQILPNCAEIMNGMKTLIARSYEEGVLVNTV